LRLTVDLRARHMILRLILISISLSISHADVNKKTAQQTAHTNTLA